MKRSDVLPCLASVALGALLAGCGDPAPDTPTEAIPRLQREIRKELPKGWQTGLARESGIDFSAYAGPDDILVWRTEKALLRQRGASSTGEEAPVRKPVHLFFAMKVRPFIQPADYPAVCATNLEHKKQQDYWIKAVAHIPRNTKGELLPRGDDEWGLASRYNKTFPTLPAYDADMPTHYYSVVAFKVWDSRPVLEPEDRILQQEMNTVYVVITRGLTPYKR